MNQSKLDPFFKFSVGLLAWVILLWMLLQAAQYMIAVVVLFGFVFLMTYVLLAPVNLVERFLTQLFTQAGHLFRLDFLRYRLPGKLSRAFSIMLVYLLFIVTVLVFSVRFIPIAFEQLLQFSNDLPKYTNDVEEWILTRQFMQSYFHEEVEALKNHGELSEPVKQQIELEIQLQKASILQKANLSPTEKQVIREKVFSMSSHVEDFTKEHIGKAFTDLFTIISTTLTGFVYALTGVVLIFYFLLDGPELKDGLLEMLPMEMQSSAEYLLSSMHGVMYGFVKGQVMLGILTGAYMIVIYSIFHVPYALFLGAFFAVSEILPVVGTWVGFLPGILVLLFLSPLKLLLVASCLYLYMLMKDNLLAPRVIGKVMGLHPVIVIVSLLVCSKTAGLVGVLFAIPVASMVNVLIRFFQRQERPHIQEVS